MTAMLGPAVVCAVATSSCLLLRAGPAPSARRLAALQGSPRTRPRRWWIRRPAAVTGAAGVLVAIAVGLPAGPAAGAAAASGLWWLLRRHDGMAGADVSALPLACDLVAAVLDAGAPLPAALRCAAGAVGGVVGGSLERVAAAFALGAPPGEAWSAVDDVPALRRLGRAAVRAADSGAALAATCRALSAEQRDLVTYQRQARAKRAGVLVTAPLACCFLPAFVLIGVVPFIAGLLHGALG